jgi:iron complex transport system substrate-binding protein
MSERKAVADAPGAPAARGRRRIVSLVPSVTELLFELGLGEQIVGVSSQCRFPPAARAKPALTRDRVSLGAGGGAGATASAAIDAAYTRFRAAEGSPYALDARLLGELAPDVIFDQGICDVCAIGDEEVGPAARALARVPDLVTVSVSTLDELLASIGVIARAAGVPERGEALRAALRARVEAVRAGAAGARATGGRPRVFCLEWLDPIWCSGHWVPELVDIAGGEDRLGQRGRPSVRRTWEEVLAWAPEVLVATPCSYGVAETLRELPTLAARPGWAALPAVRSGNVWVADSAYFSHHSHRTVEGLEMLAHILHPDRFENRWPPETLVRLHRPAEGRGR